MNFLCVIVCVVSNPDCLLRGNPAALSGGHGRKSGDMEGSRRWGAGAIQAIDCNDTRTPEILKHTMLLRYRRLLHSENKIKRKGEEKKKKRRMILDCFDKESHVY